MAKFLENLPWRSPFSAAQSFFFFLLILFAGYFVAQFVGLLFVLPFTGLSLEAIEGLVVAPFEPADRLPLLILQGTSALVSFIVTPIFFFSLIERQPLRNFSYRWSISPTDFLLVVGIVISFMPLSALVYSWNMNMELPTALDGLERWMRESEDSIGDMIGFLTEVDSIGQLLFVLVIIAVLPGIGEELVFRGVIQSSLLRWTKNPHVAIWLAAVLFSTIHLQFFGFLPRLLLGALFGYIYYWSQNLALAMFAHFLNNAYTLLMLYLFNKGYIEADMNSVEAPTLLQWLPFTVLFVLLLLGFRYVKLRSFNLR